MTSRSVHEVFADDGVIDPERFRCEDEGYAGYTPCGISLLAPRLKHSIWATPDDRVEAFRLKSSAQARSKAREGDPERYRCRGVRRGNRASHVACGHPYRGR